MRSFVLFSLTCLAVAVAGESFAFEGRVVDARTQAPVANAQVSILGVPGAVRTDADGRFRWQPDPAPPFEVLVILPGGHIARPVLIEALPATGLLTIRVEPVVEESVTVAGAAPSIEAPAAAGTTMLAAREIDIRQPSNIVQLLENVAGVSTVSEGHASVPAVRGMARGRTLILIDGARVSSERRAGPSATFLDPFVLESVEVARGPATVAYGSDALGGVIAARTRRAEPGSPLRVRAVGSFGAGVPEWRGGLEIAKGLPRGGVLFQVHARRFADYRSPGGDVPNSSARDLGVVVRAEQSLGRGLFAAGWQSDFGREIGRPRSNSTTVRFFYPREDSHRVTASYELPAVGGFERLTINSFLGSSAVVTDQVRLPTAQDARSIERADISARDYQVRVLADRLAGPARLELGVDLNGRFGLEAVDQVLAFDLADRQTGTVSNLSIDNARRHDTGVYAMAQGALSPRLTAGAGVRVDRVATTNRRGFFGDRSTARTAGSGFGSMTATLAAGLSFTGQVSRGFRDPALSDRYFRGPSGRGFITGNPDLDPETSLQFDLATRYTAGGYRVAFYAYQYRITSLIERYPGAAPDDFLFRNRGRARIRGVELEVQAALRHGVSLEAAAQLSRGVALDDGAPLDDSAPESIALQARKDFSRRAFVQVRVAAHARDDRPGPTERITPGYLVVDASGGYQVNDRLELRVLGRNLLDAAYLASPDTRPVLAPGISLLATALVRF